MDPLEEACGVDPSTVCEWVWNQTEVEALAVGTDWLLRRPLVALIIVVVALVVRRLTNRAIDRFVERAIVNGGAETVRDPAHGGAADTLTRRARSVLVDPVVRNERASQRAITLGAVLRSFATVLIVTVATLLILGEFGISLAPLIAGAGIAGVALGFGAQTVVRDVLSGIFMLVEDQFGVGDVIDVEHATGVVEGVGLRTTRLRDVEGTLWHVPNGEIRRVGNQSQLWARTILDIEVAYDTDIDRATEVIEQTAGALFQENRDDATILEQPEVWGVENFGPDSVVIRLAVKTEPSEQWRTARLLRGRLKAAFDEQGIEIPFPQRTVWLHTVDPPSDRAQGATENDAPSRVPENPPD